MTGEPATEVFLQPARSLPPEVRRVSLGALRITFENGLRMEDGARLIVGPEAEVVIDRGVLGGAGAEFVVEPGATVVLGRGVRFEGRRLLGEPERGLVERFRIR